MIKYFSTNNKMESANIYLTLVLIGITIIAVKKIEFLNLNQEVEHFGNPIALLKKIAMGIVNFFIALLDILLVIADVFAAIPVIFFVIMDVIMILFTWLWPISMIKGVVQSVFTITKMLLLMVFDFITHILRELFRKLFGLLKGGLWGIPHGPEQHITHWQSVLDLNTEFGDHHHSGPHTDDPESIFDFDQNKAKDRYRPIRCYKGIGSNGYINIISTIICPPLGVFMAFGIKGWLKIAVCALLSLGYYIPGLVYALLITTHLGLGRRITAKDCGGVVNYGIRIAGCSAIKTKRDCEDAKIPGWRDKKGDEIRSCYFKENPDEEFGGTCYNIIYPHAMHTTGWENRPEGEVGRVPGHQYGKIDREGELARDKTKRTRVDPKSIDYDPMWTADALEDEGPEEHPEKKLKDPIPIPEGPWRWSA